MDTTTRHKIAFIAGNLEDEFTNQIVKGAMDARTETGDDLFIFPAKYFRSKEYRYSSIHNRYEYQYNKLIEYAKSKSLDYIIIAASTIAVDLNHDQILELLAGFGDTPVMLVASEEEGYSDIMYDNRAGLIDGIEYLITEKGCRSFAFFGSQPGIPDCDIRLEVYRDVLAKHGIPVDENRIVRGTLTDFQVEAPQQLAAMEGIDAYVCVNDASAKALYRELKAVGKQPGKDVLILGFDNARGTERMDPPLATVKADAVQLGYQAVLAASRILKAEPSKKKIKANPQKFQVPTEFVVRESVTGEDVYITEMTSEEAKAIYAKMDFMVDMNHKTNNMTREIMMYTGIEESGGYSRFLRCFEECGVGDCFMLGLGRPQSLDVDDPLVLPEALYLYSYKNSEEIVDVPTVRQKVYVEDLFHNQYLSDEGKSYLILDIFAKEQQYGILMADIPYENFHYVEAISFQMNIVFKLTDMFRELQELIEYKEAMARNLEQENIRLEDISNRDGMTGVYNNRGFYYMVGECMKKHILQGEEAIFVFVDLNYLKKINDFYGHEDGDAAIITSAEVLCEVVGRDGIVGRLGGDEFAAFMLLETSDQSSIIYSRIKELMAERSAQLGKPYRLSASVGIANVTIAEDLDLAAVVHKADEYMYADKKKKPAFELE